MLKLIMHKHFIAITLLLLALLVSGPAEARLLLGVVTSQDGASAAITSAQARSLADLLAEKLQEDIVVKEQPDSTTLINWLDRFAMLDLALLSAEDIQSNAGKFLLIGQFEEQSKLYLASRRGGGGELPQRVASVVRESGFEPWRMAAATAPLTAASPEVIVSSPAVEASSLDAVIAPKEEFQHVPPLSPGRSWTAQTEDIYRASPPGDAPKTKKLVLGVLTEQNGLLRTSQQAEQLAKYLESTLPVSVTVREFTQLETFSAWFTRYRMLDLAILPPSVAKANLDGDYQTIARLFRTGRPSLDSIEIVVMRRGQHEELQEPLQRVLVDMAKEPEGKALMASLKISGVGLSEVVAGQSSSFEQIATPVAEREEPLVELSAEPVEQPPSSITEYTAPIEPLSPVEIVLQPLPELPEIVESLIPVVVSDVATPNIPESRREPLQPKVVQSPAVKPLVMAAPLIPVPPEVVEAPVVEVPVVEVPVVEAPVVEVPVVEAPVVEAPVVEAPVVEAPVVEAPVVEAPVVEAPVVEAPVVEVPVVEVPVVEVPVVAEEAYSVEEQKALEEVMGFPEVVSAQDQPETRPVAAGKAAGGWSDKDFMALLGEDAVASVVAQPDIPQELRPSGIPIVRPGRITRQAGTVEDELMVASMPEQLQQIEPVRPPNLLPDAEPDPGVVYVIPFVSVMVPNEVNARVFDQFIDTMNRDGEALGLQFVILKEGLQRVSPEWLAIRKYVVGEIYAYVEDSGCCSTELRSKARLKFTLANQSAPIFEFEYPVKKFFDHDRSTLDVERINIADNIAATLSSELLKVLKN